MASDSIDAASEMEDLFREIAINNRKPEAPKTGGICLNCDEIIAANRRWCDAHCRDDWERFEKL